MITLEDDYEKKLGTTRASLRNSIVITRVSLVILRRPVAQPEV